MYDALEIAKYIIDKCYRDGEPITNLRLQKLLYFIQGMYCAIRGNFIVREDFWAWKYGPVIPEIYFEYCGYIGNPIRVKYEDIDIDIDDAIFIDRVINRLKQYSDSELVDLSHAEDGPWYIHKTNRSIIKKSEIRKYFEGL